MLVYGDPDYEEDLATLLRYLHGLLTLAGSLTLRGMEALERLRWLLISVGQIQQGVEDAGENLSCQNAMQAVTEQLANAFVAQAAGICYNLPIAHWKPKGLVRAGDGSVEVGATLRAMADLIPPVDSAHNVRLTLKLPEGYAFYALYPEQYGASALRWAAEHAGETISRVRVFGIRSIGVTLAAVARAALEAGGMNATWQTVRPTGHPYERNTILPNLEIQPDEWALIVDEGPGQSGSSLASVAQALADAGMARNRIAFLPGHGNLPGGSGSEAVQHWWATTPRYVTSTADLRWNGLALADTLAAQTPQLVRNYSVYRQEEGRQEEGSNDVIDLSGDLRVTLVEDFGGGLWRRAVYPHEEEWPAVCAAFERPRYRVTLANGARVLWKFAGLASVPLPNHFLAPTAKREGWLNQSHVMELWLWMRRVLTDIAPPIPLGTALGFVATLWTEGTPLTRGDADAELIAAIGNYIGACSAPPLTKEEHQAAISRLQSVLYWNTWEALGAEWAERTKRWSATLEQSEWARQARTYGDGRLAPHEWLRKREGKLYKPDGIGYEPDHTLIGRQAIAWDVAGALVEWQLDEVMAAPLLHAVESVLVTLTPKQYWSKAAIPPDALTAYQLAYAAFRVGQTHLCANMSPHDPTEQARLWQAYTFYKDTLTRLLQVWRVR